MTYTEHDLESIQEFAISLGVRAAELARFRRSGGIEVAYSKSAIADIVTQGDRDTESFIRQELARMRPGDGFVGEESEPTRSSTGITWVVDPIDGTVNYLYGLAPCAVSIAAVTGDVTTDDWQALVGVVVSIFDQQVYSAASGRGAFLDARRVRTSETTEIPVALACTGFDYLPEIRVKQAQVLERLLARVRDIRRVGCASLELCAVASGQIDLYYETGLHPWDYAAATLIAREAGAVVRGRQGSSQPDYSLTIAGNLGLLNALQADIEGWMDEVGL
jgi:myo-inositol-1(or 4)-monophosphatase